MYVKRAKKFDDNNEKYFKRKLEYLRKNQIPVGYFLILSMDAIAHFVFL